MSGGSLNYFYSTLEDHVGDFGDKELDDLVSDLAELFHDREWYLSSDTNEGTWLEARDAFKQKWFTKTGREKRIRKYLDDVREEVLDMFGMSDKRCQNCVHCYDEGKEYDEYVSCDITKGCLMHRSERCDNFARKGGQK